MGALVTAGVTIAAVAACSIYGHCKKPGMSGKRNLFHLRGRGPRDDGGDHRKPKRKPPTKEMEIENIRGAICSANPSAIEYLRERIRLFHNLHPEERAAYENLMQLLTDREETIRQEEAEIERINQARLEERQREEVNRQRELDEIVARTAEYVEAERRGELNDEDARGNALNPDISPKEWWKLE